MAITKLMHIKARRSGNLAEGLKTAINYIVNPKKTRDGNLVGTLNCTSALAYQKMIATKKLYGKEDGRQGYHFVLSFSPGEVTAEKAYQLTEEFCRTYLGTNYECVFAVHDDKEHIHSHIVFNSVSIKTGLKYHYKNGDWRKYIQPITNQICEKYGLETIDVNDRPITGDFDDYGKWEGNTKKLPPTNRDELRMLIDRLIPEVGSVKELINRLQINGCSVRDGKYLSIKLPTAERAIRSYRLGIAYEKENLERRIAGEKIVAPYIMETRSEILPEQYKIVRAGFKQAGRRSRYTSEYYKYKEEAEKLSQVNIKNRYLTTHHIVTLEQLDARRKAVQSNIATYDKKRKEIFESRRNYQNEIEIIKSLPRMEAEKRLSEMGFDADSLFAFEAATAGELSQLKYGKRELQKELQIIEKIDLHRTGKQL